MRTHECIKPACANKYESVEEEAYYCPTCTEANKAIAKKIDAQVAARPTRSRVNAVQEYEAAQKIKIGNLPGVHVKI